MERTILFLCPHNAAKSVLAAAYCRQLLRARGLAVRVDSAGTEPAAAVSPAVSQLLESEGAGRPDHQPRRVTAADLAGAWRVISLGCDPADLPAAGPPPEQWREVPLPSQDLAGAWAAIRVRVERLVAELEGSP